jgi:hypothetical protein
MNTETKYQTEQPIATPVRSKVIEAARAFMENSYNESGEDWEKDPDVMMADFHLRMVEPLTQQVADLEAEVARLREALERIAAYDDHGAEEVLEAKGSYGCFDEPVSVQIAREALQAISRIKEGR